MVILTTHLITTLHIIIIGITIGGGHLITILIIILTIQHILYIQCIHHTTLDLEVTNHILVADSRLHQQTLDPVDKADYMSLVLLTDLLALD